MKLFVLFNTLVRWIVVGAVSSAQQGRITQKSLNNWKKEIEEGLHMQYQNGCHKTKFAPMERLQIKIDVEQCIEEAVKEHLNSIDDRWRGEFSQGHYAPEYHALCDIYNLHLLANDEKYERIAKTYPEGLEDLKNRLSGVSFSVTSSDGKINYAISGKSYKKKHETEKKTATKKGSLNGEQEEISTKELELSTSEVSQIAEINSIYENLTHVQQKAAKKLEIIWNKATSKKDGLEKKFKDARMRYVAKINDAVNALQKIADIKRAKEVSGQQVHNGAQTFDCLDMSTEEAQGKAEDGVCQKENVQSPKQAIIKMDGKVAGQNILVDMACLCIPSKGERTACLGSQALKCWTADASEGPEAPKIKHQIDLLHDGCKKYNNDLKISASRIVAAQMEFDHVLGRWKKDANGYSAGNLSKKEGEGNRAVLGMKKKTTITTQCDGSEGQHCVDYNGGSANGGDNLKNNHWYKHLEDAKNFVHEAEQHEQTLHAIQLQVQTLIALAKQVVSEVKVEEQLAPKRPKVPTPHEVAQSLEFDQIMNMYCTKKNKEKCKKAPICTWHNDTKKCGPAESVKVPVTTPATDAERQKQFEKLKESCANLTGEVCTKNKHCKLQGQQCVPAPAAEATLSLKPSNAHFPPFLFYLPLLF